MVVLILCAVSVQIVHTHCRAQNPERELMSVVSRPTTRRQRCVTTLCEVVLTVCVITVGVVSCWDCQRDLGG